MHDQKLVESNGTERGYIPEPDWNRGRRGANRGRREANMMGGADARYELRKNDDEDVYVFVILETYFCFSTRTKST